MNNGCQEHWAELGFEVECLNILVFGGLSKFTPVVGAKLRIMVLFTLKSIPVCRVNHAITLV